MTGETAELPPAELERLFREFAAQQSLHEYLAVAHRIRQRLWPLQHVIEVGSSSGGTLALWAAMSHDHALIISVDIPQGPQQCFSVRALRRAAAGRNFLTFRADSRLPATRDRVCRALGAAKADLLFIDADHSAAAVRSDLRLYGPLVRDGGLIAFHDIVPHPELPNVRVHELWQELRASFPEATEEILENPDQTWGGIGLLSMDNDVRAFIGTSQSIPILINNFNRLATTRALAAWASTLNRGRVAIIDNNSDWPPLLEWYAGCEHEVKRLGANLGHRAPWISGVVDEVGSAHYVVTDSDLDMETCPKDVLDVLEAGLTRYPWAMKAGVGLEIKDLNFEHPSRERVLSIETGYWSDRLDSQFFRAAVDTTFALYRSGVPFALAPALRSDRPYVARHVPWYSNPASLTDEERHFVTTANPQASTWAAQLKSALGI